MILWFGPQVVNVAGWAWGAIAVLLAAGWQWGDGSGGGGDCTATPGGAPCE